MSGIFFLLVELNLRLVDNVQSLLWVRGQILDCNCEGISDVCDS